MKKIILALASLGALTLFAETLEGSVKSSTINTETQLLLWLLGIVLFLGITTVLISLRVIILLVNQENIRKGLPEINIVGEFWKKIDKSFVSGDKVPLEKESKVLLPHSYDGISELNNHMPPWLRNLFIATIGFAAIYLFIYYVAGVGKFQEQEYEEELRIAAIKKEEFMKKIANSIDESNVKLDPTDMVMIEKGKAIFMSNCKACHGENGEGGVGPNLTDAYWIHGNTINDVFKVVKYGVPEKGMIAWQSKMTPLDIQSVSNYIFSLQGTHPANAKLPEGTNYGETLPESDVRESNPN